MEKTIFIKSGIFSQNQKNRFDFTIARFRFIIDKNKVEKIGSKEMSF